MSPALAGSASLAQSPRHLPFTHSNSRHFRHLTSHHLTSSRIVLFPSPPTKVNLRTAPDTPPDRPRLNHRLTTGARCAVLRSPRRCPAARDTSGQSQGGERRPGPGQTSPQAPRGRAGRPGRHVARQATQPPPHSSGRWQHPPPPCCNAGNTQIHTPPTRCFHYIITKDTLLH